MDVDSSFVIRDSEKHSRDWWVMVLLRITNHAITNHA